MKKILCGVVFFLSVFSTSVYSFEATMNENGEVIQKTGQGEINWTKGILSANGFADPNQPVYAQQVAAAADARANLLMILNEVSIKRGITVEKGLLTQDINIQTVQGTLQGAIVSELKRDPNGMPMVVVYKKITPDMLRAIMPDKLFTPEAGEKPFTPELASTPAPAPVSMSYTGLIIDARGSGIAPSLGLNIVAEGSNQVLYGTSFATRAKVLEKGGMAGYSGSLDKAKTNSRVGKNPLIVKAISSCGERNTDVLISKEDAARIYSENLKNPFLKDLSVIVVCGS